MSATLYYANDPMCSWCRGFRPAWQSLWEQLPPELRVVRLPGGLAPDNDAPMPEQLRHHLQQTWRRIEQRIPGTRSNFEFWQRCHPRRSTYPACRALIAARTDPDAVGIAERMPHRAGGSPPAHSRRWSHLVTLSKNKYSLFSLLLIYLHPIENKALRKVGSLDRHKPLLQLIEESSS